MPDWDALARAAAAVREISNRERPPGQDALDMAAWFAEQFGALQWHAETLADEIDRQIANHK